jgi:N-methylhydantoinase A/oxoprolinase/acetone carboxylase beta subunit
VNREALPPGYRQEGPLIVEEATATTLVPPRWALSVLDSGDLTLERSAP